MKKGSVAMGMDSQIDFLPLGNNIFFLAEIWFSISYLNETSCICQIDPVRCHIPDSGSSIRWVVRFRNSDFVYFMYHTLFFKDSTLSLET